MDIELRELQESDIEMVRSWRNSPEVSSFMYSDEFISEEDQKMWFLKTDADSTCINWIISFDKKPLGLVSLSGINKTLDSCYWAFYLGDTSVRRQGIGSKIEYNVLKYVFDHLELNKLRCEVFTFNDNVIKMHEKFGFRREAFYREHCKKNDKWEDVVGLAMTKKEWNSLKESMYERIYKKI